MDLCLGKQHRSIDVTLCWDDGDDGDSTVTSAVTFDDDFFSVSYLVLSI